MKVQPPVSNAQLDLVSTDRLAQALFRRSRACVLVVMRYQQDDKPNVGVWTCASREMPNAKSLMDCLVECAANNVEKNFGDT